MECNICFKHFTQESDLINHMETIHNVFKCNSCKYYTKQKGHLRRHELNKHSGFVKCNHCNRKFSSKEMLNEHIDRDHQPLSCHFCDFYTRNRQSFLRHIKKMHNSQSTHVMKRNTTKNDPEKIFNSSNHQIDIQQIEDNTRSTSFSKNDIIYNQVQEESFVRTPENKRQDFDDMLKINSSFPNINNHWSQLVEYRVKLLTVAPTLLHKGECKDVATNCVIEDDLKLCMHLKKNKELNLLFEEVFIIPQKQTVTVKLTNIDEEVKIIPVHFCVGYLIVTHPKQ